VAGRQTSPNLELKPKSPEKSTSTAVKDFLSGIKIRNPIKWPFSSESEQKPVQESQDSANSAMTFPFRGKVFVYDKSKGMWIDQEYKPELQEWHCWTLTPGSEEYKRALASEPQLKDFFDHAPILIVWKNNTIYKVRKPEQDR
jgi:hypothetical protein